MIPRSRERRIDKKKKEAEREQEIRTSIVSDEGSFSTVLCTGFFRGGRENTGESEAEEGIQKRKNSRRSSFLQNHLHLPIPGLICSLDARQVLSREVKEM